MNVICVSSNLSDSLSPHLQLLGGVSTVELAFNAGVACWVVGVLCLIAGGVVDVLGRIGLARWLLFCAASWALVLFGVWVCRAVHSGIPH